MIHLSHHTFSHIILIVCTTQKHWTIIHNYWTQKHWTIIHRHLISILDQAMCSEHSRNLAHKKSLLQKNTNSFLNKLHNNYD